MKKILKRNKRLVFIIFPAVFIFLSFLLGFIDILNPSTSKTLILMSLLIITPFVFIINGILSQKFKSNVILFSLPSYISFTFVFFIWLNSTAIFYYVLYLISNILGVFLYKFDEKMDEKKEKKREKNLENTGFYRNKK